MQVSNIRTASQPSIRTNWPHVGPHSMYSAIEAVDIKWMSQSYRSSNCAKVQLCKSSIDRREGTYLEPAAGWESPPRCPAETYMVSGFGPVETHNGTGEGFVFDIYIIS